MLGTGGTFQKRTYLNIKEGSIVKHTKKGEELFTFVEGRIEDIFLKERTFRGEEVVTYWYMDIRDTATGELYSLGFPYGSNVFKSIVLHIASEDGLRAVQKQKAIRIETYFSKGYTKVRVSVGEYPLKWTTSELPPLGELHVGDRTIKDDSKRMELITSLVDRILDRIPSKQISKKAIS